MKIAKKIYRRSFELEIPEDMKLWISMPDVGKEIVDPCEDNREHKWERDGQTMMSTRWVCIKCGKLMVS